MSQALVSVIIPAYNAEAFIERTLESVLNQTHRNLEVLVVDDGSQDRTVEQVCAIAERDRRVVLLQQSNQGVAAARNLAIEHAQGAFIAPLDADDVWYPQKLERQVACMEQGGASLGLVYAWWVMIDEEDRLIKTSAKWDLAGHVYEALVFVNFVGNASIPLIRKACIEKVGGYSTRLKAMQGQGCEDWDLALRIAEQYKVGVVPAYLCGYRRVLGSMSTNFKAMARSHKLILADIQVRHPSIPGDIFRVSQGTFCSYLGRLSYREKNYEAARYWLYQAFTVDPTLAMSFSFVKFVIKSLLRRFSGSLLPRVVSPYRKWLQRRRQASADGPHSLEALARQRSSVPRSWTWKSWQPYNWICLYRWRRVKALLEKRKQGATTTSVQYRTPVQGVEASYTE